MSVLYRSLITEDGGQHFDHAEEPFDRHLHISDELWHDLGKPDVITVTIEPGDLLNEEQT